MNALHLPVWLSFFAAITTIGCGASDEAITTDRRPAQPGSTGAEITEPVVVECTSCTERNSLLADGCATAAQADELEAAATVAFTLEHSVHELIACGALSREIPIALVETTVSLIADAGGSSLPAGFEFREGGLYHADGNGASMDVRLFFDSGVGYEVVKENLFDIDSYFVGASIEASASIDFAWTDPLATSVDVDEPHIAYDEVGPWALLLGFEPAPPNPIRVTDLDDISLRFDELRAQVNVHYEEERDGVRITYDVESPLVGFDELLGGGRLAFRARSIDGRTADGSMTIAVDDGGWDIDFTEGNELDGSVAFTVQGGTVPITGSLVYDEAAYADVALRCMP